MGNKKKTLIIIATAITVAIVLAILLSLRGCKSQIMSTCTIIGFYADQDSEVFNVVTVGDHKKVHIRLKKNEMYCPACGSRMKSKGWRSREVNHPVLQGGSHLVLVLHQRKWHCPYCGEYTYDQFCFVEKYKQNTMLVPYMIIDAMRCVT